MASDSQTTVTEKLANALEALVERCFNRNLFPHEVKAAFAALDTHEKVSNDDQS